MPTGPCRYGDRVQPLEVVGVRMEMPSNNPIILLKVVGGDRYLPIWVGAVEATAIAYAQQGVVPPRPLTHDLFTEVLAALSAPVTEVHITSVKNGVYYAELHLANGLVISARPSDAIALALRAQAPILGAPDLLAEAGVEIPEEEMESGEDEVEKFREFLNQISPEDFGEPSS